MDTIDSVLLVGTPPAILFLAIVPLVLSLAGLWWWVVEATLNYEAVKTLVSSV